MSALQKVNLGTAPAGVDGDAVRTAFIKDNANVDVLNSQTFLTSATLITSAQALTTAHIGKRVNINLGSPGTINLPSASTCAADQVTLLRNLGTTVVTLVITTGSGDTVSISKLNPGESALMDTDGLHAWTCLMRSRTNSDNETVNGNSTVVGNETVGGTLGVTGAASFATRPTFAGNTPFDSGNFSAAGNASQIFAVAAALGLNDAVNRGQLKIINGTNMFTLEIPCITVGSAAQTVVIVCGVGSSAVAATTTFSYPTGTTMSNPLAAFAQGQDASGNVHYETTINSKGTTAVTISLFRAASGSAPSLVATGGFAINWCVIGLK